MRDDGPGAGIGPVTRPAARGRRGGWEIKLPARWRLQRFLGAGGQSEVWLAHDEELDQQVAIKVFAPDLSDEALERLRREVRLGRTLQNPHLVRVYELIEDGGRLAMAMAWLPGGSLAQRLAERGPLPIAEVVQATDEALAALAYLHEQRIVHRDVKPSNLLLNLDGRVYLADLGLVRGLDEQARLTRTEMVVGTPVYMSPEQIRAGRLTPASDLYSLGVTVFQLLAGHPPFEGSSEFDVAHRHLRTPAPDVRSRRADCPRWLARFVARLLEKRPEDRWPDAAAARGAFVRHATPLSPRRRRRIVLTGAAVLAMTAAVALGARWVVRLAAPRAAVSVVAEGRVVRVLGSSGQETWRRELPVPIDQVERGDIDGDGRSDTVVVANEPHREDREAAQPSSELLVVGATGDVIVDARVRDLIGSWPWSFPLDSKSQVTLLDADLDGRKEIILSTHHRLHYPTDLRIYWPRTGTWQRLLQHPGYIYDVAVLPDRSLPRLRYFAFANELAMNAVVGELMLSVPGRAGTRPVTTQPGLFGEGPGVEQAWYTLLGQRRPGDRDRSVGVTIEAGGATRLVVEGRPVRLDRFGNPSDGPNWGADLSAARQDFLTRLHRLTYETTGLGPARVADEEARLRRDFSALLREPAYANLLELRGAEALALAGERDAAIRRLERAARERPGESVDYRLAHLLALDGRLDEAVGVIRRLGASYQTPAAHFDGVRLLFRVATEWRNEELLKEAQASVVSWWAGSDFLAVPAAADLWWDRVSDVDGRARSSDRAPEGSAIACLARWRLGRTVPGDIDAMQRSLELNPDAEAEGRLALAASLSALGRHDEALAAFPALEGQLESRARLEFPARQLLDLTEAVHAKVLLASGNVDGAQARAQSLMSRLRPGLLPAGLAAEVLAAEP
ncbi:MAG: serine/threonine protein kinase [Acidobacteria bacterium]|nr:serine/threonine protein kinase [Acidobacteriota bacterium]